MASLRAGASARADPNRAKNAAEESTAINKAFQYARPFIMGLLDAIIGVAVGAVGRIARGVQKFAFLFAGRALVGRRVLFHLVSAIGTSPSSHISLLIDFFCSSVGILGPALPDVSLAERGRTVRLGGLRLSKDREDCNILGQ